MVTPTRRPVPGSTAALLRALRSRGDADRGGSVARALTPRAASGRRCLQRTKGLEDEKVLKMLREVGSLLLIAKEAYTLDEDDSILLARRLRWLRDETEPQPVQELKLAA